MIRRPLPEGPVRTDGAFGVSVGRGRVARLIPMPFVIRPAVRADFDAAEEVEREADRLFAERFEASDWPPPEAAAERAAQPGFLLVGEEDGVVVGFAHVLEIAGIAHLEQVAVLPRCARRGYGRMLVEAAKAAASAHGHGELTLRTYADVPWNAPFYATCGFAVSEPVTPFLKSLVDVEESLGLMRHGARVQMTALL